jgi:hypothetical protein
VLAFCSLLIKSFDAVSEVLSGGMWARQLYVMSSISPKQMIAFSYDSSPLLASH